MRLRAALAFASFVVIGLLGGSTGVVLPAQSTEYELTKTVIGLLFFAFSVGYVVAGAVIGAVMHRLGVRGTLLAGTATFGVAAAICGLRPPYPVLLAVTAFLAIGIGTIDACLNAYLSGLPGSTVLLNLLHAFYGVGALIGPLLAAALLAAGRSWGAVYLVFAVLTVPLLAAFAAWYPPGTGSAVAVPEGVRPGSLSTAVRRAGVVLAALFLAGYVGVEVSVGNWGYSYLTQYREHGPLLAGWVVSGYWFGFTLGRFLMGAVAARYRLGPAVLTYACLVGMLAFGAFTWLVPGTAGTVAGFFLLGLFIGPVFPLTIAIVPQLAPAWLVPTAIGLLVGVSVAGGAFFPWLAGTLAQHAGLGTLFPFVVVLCAALIVVWWQVVHRARAPLPTDPIPPAVEPVPPAI